MASYKPLIVTTKKDRTENQKNNKIGKVVTIFLTAIALSFTIRIPVVTAIIFF